MKEQKGIRPRRISAERLELDVSIIKLFDGIASDEESIKIFEGIASSDKPPSPLMPTKANY